MTGRVRLASIVALHSLGVAAFAETPLISRQILFGNPDRVAPQISPDGSRVAYLAPSDGRMNVWVGPHDAPDKAAPVTHDTKRGIRQYFWAQNNRQIIYLQDEGGDENWRVFTADIETGQTRDLTPFKDVAARIQEISPKCPGEILVALNKRDPRLHDVFRIDLTSGAMQPVAENSAEHGFVSFISDDDYNVRFAAKITATGGEEIHRATPGGGWELFQSIPLEDTVATEPLGFDATGRTLYMRDSRGRDTAALCALDLTMLKSTVLAEDPRADAAGAMVHPTSHIVQAVAFDYERKHWKILDPALEPVFAALQKVATGDMAVVSRSLDDRRWIVAYESDNEPTSYYLFEPATGEARFLFMNRSKLKGASLAEMKPVVIPARDGLSLVSYLTLPVGAAPDGAKPAEPLPMVLLVHGGPWARDVWGLNPMHQWLANRGYAVLSVNYRGSTGFGKKFGNAANHEWAGKMHDDLIDAVRWTIDGGFADPKRIGIMGGSYGGYATLVGLTYTPDVFACGVDIVGPSNLVTLLESIPPYWTPMIESFAKRVGDHRTPEGRKFLMDRSPLSRVEHIRRPLLIGQGANDPRVKQNESDQIVDAMRQRNIPVTYVLYPDEGHGFQRPENRMSFNAVTEAFLAQHLGGRVEPIGDDFKGASISVPVGGDFIPNLKQLLVAR